MHRSLAQGGPLRCLQSRGYTTFARSDPGSMSPKQYQPPVAPRQTPLRNRHGPRQLQSHRRLRQKTYLFSYTERCEYLGENLLGCCFSSNLPNKLQSAMQGDHDQLFAYALSQEFLRSLEVTLCLTQQFVVPGVSHKQTPRLLRSQFENA